MITKQKNSFRERLRNCTLAVFFVFPMPGAAIAQLASCIAKDFFTLALKDLPVEPEVGSVLMAYDGFIFDASNNALVANDGATLVIEENTNRSAKDILNSPTFGDQFRYVYPLAFDLDSRGAAWFDPGRVRNKDFFQFIFHNSETDARESLLWVTSQQHDVRFQVTQKQGVACQLQAALDAITAKNADVFSNVGGSFNWRLISGTNRLSVHSYGAAIDLNAALGGYWKWSGRSAGNVGFYDNKIPTDVVQIFERFGFIWGGKWHHFDGMHFEYRPELILYSRMMSIDR